MAASTTQNTTIKPESKSGKKKKAKGDVVAASISTPVSSEAPQPTVTSESIHGDERDESPYIKELQKNIRNVNKKITNASKIDNILIENPQMSLDELVASRKINADQRTQAQNKPKLQATLAQLEEQIQQYRKFELDFKTKAHTEKADFEKAFSEKASQDLVDAIAAAKAEAASRALKEQQDNLLVLSQFLRLAAARRAEDAESTLEENVALEGVLVEVYSGDETAVSAMTKLINGSDDKTSSIHGDKLPISYAQVKAAAVAYAPYTVPAESLSEDSHAATAVETSTYPVESDPTIANAGLTEINEPSVADMTNGHSGAVDEPSSGRPQNSSFGDGSANAAAESQWDNANDLSASQEWVEVPRDAAETDTGVTATPAAASNTERWTTTATSWADDQPDTTPTEVAANANDGFHEVSRSRGNTQGRGGRGGEGGGYRGRGGYRGNENGYRGRGRGRGRRPDDS